MSAVLIRADARALPLASESVDAVICDAPYGISGQGRASKSGGDAVNVDFGGWDRAPEHGHIPECARVLKPGGAFVSFTGLSHVSHVWDLALKSGLHPRHTVYWIKTNPPPSPRKNFRSGVEVAVYATKPGAPYFWGGGQPTNYWIEPLTYASFGELLHPCQKPIALMRWLIRLVSKPGSTILDCYAGSGTTGIAAEIDGRNSILIEREAEYCRTIRARMLGADSIDADGTPVFDNPRLPGLESV